MKNILIIIICLLFCLGCKDEFLLISNNYTPGIVVDGLISNKPGPYTVRLSKSSPVTRNERIPLTNCTVTIFENNLSEILTETEPGVYKTSEEGIKGTIGNAYYILFETPNGETYTSKSQEMNQFVEIDTLYAKLEYKKDINYVHDLPGYQFYITTKLAENKHNYLLWQLEETYQYTSDYRLEYIFDGEEFLYVNLGQLPEYKNIYRCWKTQNAGYIFTGNTTNLSIPLVSEQPLHFVGTNTKKLQERYSLNVIQYSIDKIAYSFWKSIEDQTSQNNFLTTNQPYTIIGNIKNIDNPDEVVYGYFTVASVTEKRIFVDRPITPFYYNKCIIMDKAPYLPPHFYASDENDNTGIVLESCIDCRLNGGVTLKPDFWIDK